MRSVGQRAGIAPATPARADRLTEPFVVRWALIGIAAGFLLLFLALPLAAVFIEALANGPGSYVSAIGDPDAVAALKLTLSTAAIAVPLNLAFGLAAGWTIARARFRGRSVLTTLVDLPFAVSPVIAGLVFVLLAGRQGLIGPWLAAHDIHIIFAAPGIVLASLFVSAPFVAREITPILDATGTQEEEAARVLGASGWQTFTRVTLPNIKWGVIYGAILCSARVLGEFGAVSVVSGHIRGVTNTLPLHVEVLYNEYRFQAAFAVASMLTCVALVTLVVKTMAERRAR